MRIWLRLVILRPTGVVKTSSGKKKTKNTVDKTNTVNLKTKINLFISDVEQKCNIIT